MEKKPHKEPFFVDQEFFTEFYDYIFNKYAKAESPFSIQELLEDLQEGLGCRTAALLQYNDRPTEEKVTILYNSRDLKKSREWKKGKSLINKRIGEMLLDDCSSGDTLQLEMPAKGKKWKDGIIDVVLIPMPRLANLDDDSLFDQLFIFIDPVELEPYGLKRHLHESQRILIAQSLCDWWVRALAPSFHPQHHKENQDDQNDPEESNREERIATDKEEKDDDRSQRLWSSRRYIASPSVLIDEGDRSKEYLRRTQQADSFYFQGDKNGLDKFEWEKWNPLKPGNDDRIIARRETEMLVYWCRWKDAHHDLEREQATSSKTPYPKDRAPTEVHEWVKKQRTDFTAVNDKLEELRLLAAEIFMTGRAEQTPESGTKEHLLPIGSKSLLWFSLEQWLKDDGWLRRNLFSGAFSDIEFCRSLHNLAITTHYLMGQQRPQEMDVIHRLERQVAQYGHEELKIPDRIDLRAHLLQAARGEPVLFALKEFYRGHFFHALEVCFLGHLLLETQIKGGKPLWKLVARNLSLSCKNKKPILRLWYTAALTHDIGYAMHVLNSSRGFFKFFKHSTELEALCKNLDDATKNFSKEIDLKKIGVHPGRNPEETQNLCQDHGVVGALHLQSLLMHISKEDPNIKPDEFQPAIKAIALHNLHRPIEDKISFAKEPLAFLLALCDQLQEWHRFQLDYGISPQWMLARLSGAAGEEGDQEGTVDSIAANFKIFSRRRGAIHLQFPTNSKRKSQITFTIEYNKKINQNSGVFFTWLPATRNFQRLDLDGLPLDISIKFINPLFTNKDYNTPEAQMHRLRNAAFDTHMTFLMDWFPNQTLGGSESKTVTNGAVTYHEGKDKEELTLNLRELAKKPLMTKGMRPFAECLKNWKHYNDDRDFPGDYAPVIPD